MNMNCYEVQKQLMHEIETEKGFSLKKLVKLIELSSLTNSFSF